MRKIWTGMTDKYGKKIHEGDIIRDENWWWGACFVVKYVDANTITYLTSQDIKDPINNAIHNEWEGAEVEVIGNINKNPELLKTRSINPERDKRDKEFWEPLNKAFNDAFYSIKYPDVDTLK